jgi:monothiol glutaredoxin
MSIEATIKEQLINNDVVLYMKGTPVFPQCGFSGKAAYILKQHKQPFLAINVLEDDAIREGIKQYANWPTIPQLYIKGELVGGSDIIEEMHENGSLEATLQNIHATE